MTLATTTRLASTALALAILTTACGAKEEAGSPDASTPRRPTTSVANELTLAQARAVMSAYDKRNTAAIRRAGAPAYDDAAWTAVDTETVLAADVYATRVQKAKKAGKDASDSPFTHGVAAVSGGSARSADGQGRWALLDLGTRTAEGETYRTVASIVPSKQPGSWLLAASMTGPAKVPLPKTTPGGVLSAAQRQQLANMVPAVTRALSVGNYEEVEQNGLLTQLRRRTSAEPTPGDKASQGWLGTLNCSPWGARSDVDMYKAVVVGTPSLRVLRGEGTTLSVLSLDCALTVQDAHGERKIQLEKPYAIAQGDDGTFKERLQRRFVVSLLVSTPDHGKPAVLAGSGSYAVPAGR